MHAWNTRALPFTVVYCVQTTDGLMETVRDLQEKNADLNARLEAAKSLRDALSIAQSKVAEGEAVQQVWRLLYINYLQPKRY